MADIRGKIEKLLALSKSSNEHEAKSALLKAKELMAANKMEMADFEDLKKQELVHREVADVHWTTDSGEIWISSLAKIIADNHCCSAAWTTFKGKRTHTLQLTGFEEDVEVCKAVIIYAVGVARHAIKMQCYRNRDASGRDVSVNYGRGFVLGLKEMYDQQAEEHAEWGLVVVKPQKVQEYEQTLGHKNVQSRRARSVEEAFASGLEDGRNFNSNNKLQAKEA